MRRLASCCPAGRLMVERVHPEEIHRNRVGEQREQVDLEARRLRASTAFPGDALGGDLARQRAARAFDHQLARGEAERPAQAALGAEQPERGAASERRGEDAATMRSEPLHAGLEHEADRKVQSPGSCVSSP